MDMWTGTCCQGPRSAREVRSGIPCGDSSCVPRHIEEFDDVVLFRKNTTHVELGFSLFFDVFRCQWCCLSHWHGIQYLCACRGFRGRLVESFSAGLVVPHRSAFHQVFLSLLRGRHRLCDPGRHCPSAPHVTVFSCFVCLTERNIHGGFFLVHVECLCSSCSQLDLW